MEWHAEVKHEPKAGISYSVALFAMTDARKTGSSKVTGNNPANLASLLSVDDVSYSIGTAQYSNAQWCIVLVSYAFP